MRWKLVPESREHGETRWVRRFAWWPTKVDDCRVWLERYDVKQSWVDARDVAGEAFWMDGERRLLAR